MLLQQLFTMEKYQNCNCIERLEEIAWRMHSLRSRLQSLDFWLQGLERRFTYIPATENMDNPPAYMMCRRLIDVSKNTLDDTFKNLRSLVQKQRRNGHTAPATRRQSRRLLKQHHDLVANKRAQCIALYDRISDALRTALSYNEKFSYWLVPSVTISDEQVASGDECAVCLEPFAIDEVVSQLGCSHCFHINCLDPLITTNWQSNNFRCPLCRRPFLERP